MGYVFSNTELMFGKTPEAQRDALGLGACATMDDCGGGGGTFDPAADYNVQGNWVWDGTNIRPIRVLRVANASATETGTIQVGTNSGNNSGRPDAGHQVGRYEYIANHSDSASHVAVRHYGTALENWSNSGAGPHGTGWTLQTTPRGTTELAETITVEEDGVIDYLGNDATPPGDAATVATWITIKKDGVAYKIPGYQ